MKLVIQSIVKSKEVKEVGGSSPPWETNLYMKNFIKFTLIWISQNLAIPFWVVGHIHLSIHDFHDLVEIFSSIGMNIIVGIGFYMDFKNNTNEKEPKTS